jgi:hypothetical protein
VDVQGAPLAYTPFCDNNKDMDGFRFWKQGFWQSHLKDRPYHISALYVVDLAKFRSPSCLLATFQAVPISGPHSRLWVLGLGANLSGPH